MKILIPILVLSTAAGLIALAAPQPARVQMPVRAPRNVAASFNPPAGYRRVAVASGSFGEWLRNCPVKPPGTQVRLFDGRIKPDNGVYAGVLDLDIGKADLQQCADAVMRLRAEYLFGRGQFLKIGFHYTNGFMADYQHWREGFRPSNAGGKTTWVRRAATDTSYAQFRRYLENVFAYAGTKSLEQELLPVAVGTMQPGDVFIRGGSPGHAVLVLDMAENPDGRRVYLLCQSYIPAQDIQVLREPSSSVGGIWYPLPQVSGSVVTPEWVFTTGQLRRFP